MIKKTALILFTLALSSTAYSQSFDSIDECQALKSSVRAAIAESDALDTLLAPNPDLTDEIYLAQLYEGVKILSKSGESFFKAADEHESVCRTQLKQVNKIEEIRVVYDWYLEPTKRAYQFFKRAREAAIQLHRQADVDAFNTMMTEYDAAVMKLVAVCQADLENSPQLATCTALSAKLSDTLK